MKTSAKAAREARPAPRTVMIMVGLLAFSTAFALLDQGFNHFITPRLPPVGASAWLATLYGVVSRLHLIIPLVVLAMWRPRLLGFRAGRTRRHWRLLLLMLVANCGVVGAYLVYSGGATPYSGNEWLLTEVVVVPLVEETMWRGAVFAALLSAFRGIYSGARATTLAVWSSGLAFGLLHATNVLVGVPLLFVAIQVLNAAVWGIVYGYARAVTHSVYPPIVLHAAMNLVVVIL